MSRLRIALLVTVLMAAIAFPIGVLASHQFGDVPTSNPYHGDIAALVDAGVTTGCGAGIYCPKDYVTREQMAAFMNRLGALGPGKSPVVNADRVDGLQASQLLRSDVAVAGSTTCAGSSMQPELSSTEYSFDGTYIYPVSGDYWFTCQLHVPDGATLTSFTSYLRDQSASAAADCELYRTAWSTGSLSTLADTAATSVAGTPGQTEASTSSFVDATVDNAAYAYWAECGAMAFGGSVAILGVRLAFSVSGIAEE